MHDFMYNVSQLHTIVCNLHESIKYAVFGHENTEKQLFFYVFWTSFLVIFTTEKDGFGSKTSENTVFLVFSRPKRLFSCFQHENDTLQHNVS